MVLERWDTMRRKWIMYNRPEDHTADCQRYPFEEIPARVFLDTSVVNLIVKYAPSIFGMERQCPAIALNRAREIEALMHVFAVGAGASWTLHVSTKTLAEVQQTTCQNVREELAAYVCEILHCAAEESRYCDDLGRSIANSTLLSALPDAADQELLGNAIGLGCDAFVTADIRTIVSKRDVLPDLPLRVLTPTEWWSHIKPWGGLWI